MTAGDHLSGSAASTRRLPDGHRRPLFLLQHSARPCCKQTGAPGARSVARTLSLRSASCCLRSAECSAASLRWRALSCGARFACANHAPACADRRWVDYRSCRGSVRPQQHKGSEPAAAAPRQSFAPAARSPSAGGVGASAPAQRPGRGVRGGAGSGTAAGAVLSTRPRAGALAPLHPRRPSVTGTRGLTASDSASLALVEGSASRIAVDRGRGPSRVSTRGLQGVAYVAISQNLALT